MPTLLLTSRYTSDAQALWRAAGREGWRVERVRGVEVPADLDPNDDVALLVEVLFAPELAQRAGVTLLEPPAGWLAALPREWVRRDLRLTTLGEARRLDQPAFVKPPNDKSFPAAVYPDGSLLPDGDDASPTLVAEPVRSADEYRAFCLDGEVATLSPYLRDGQLALDAPKADLEAAWVFAGEVAKDPAMPRAVVVDVGRIDGRGWAVVEANPAWASGLYNCDARQALRVIAAACVRA